VQYRLLVGFLSAGHKLDIECGTIDAECRNCASKEGVLVNYDTRDPDHPSRLSPRFASRDHLHPNDVGYRAMADAIDLALFK